MKFRRRQRWLRRFALAFAFATAVFAGKVSTAVAKFDDGGARAQTTIASPSGDEIAINNALAERKLAGAEAVHDPHLTDVFVRQGESLGGPDGSAQVSKTSETAFIPGVTDFPKPETAATRPDDQAARFTGMEQPQVINYLSHGMAADGEVGARPDNRADRFTTADGVSQPRVEVSGSRDWDGALTMGIGAVVLLLGIGLAVGYLRRPRLAL